jgi:hypothetical protein
MIKFNQNILNILFVCFLLMTIMSGTAKAYFSSGGTASMQQWSHGGNKFISI